MPALIPALVNPPLLVWAREESGYEPEWVAKKLSVKPERLLAWEQGERKPTVRQTQDLAKLYHRPFGVFFLPQPPVLPPLAGEYRRLPGVEPGVESPELRLALRVMSQRREITLGLLEELGAPIAEFRTTAHLSEGAHAIGARLRALLGVTVQEQLGWSSEWEAWRQWRAAVEAAGVLVFQFPKVPLPQVRGVSLLKCPLPVIGLNSKEGAPGARIFTLLHELVHVALAAGRDEQSAIQETRSDTAWSKVERFAEEAASAALIPDDVFWTFVGRMSVPRDGWDVALVRTLAAKFRVTPLAMATRLRAAGAVTWNGYERWKSAWGECVAALVPRSGGFASPVDKTLGRSGRPFAQLVIQALDANRITAVEASRYLDLRFHHFDKLRSDLRLGSRSGATADDGE
jgi:Zn-dependent peptidase ImmA (M78 family)/transcriptional regulator with XRE-family HTH domain